MIRALLLTALLVIGGGFSFQLVAANTLCSAFAAATQLLPNDELGLQTSQYCFALSSAVDDALGR